MIEENNIIETINMIKLYNLDIRTVTLALSLRDCMSEDINKVCDNIYNKIKNYAKNLVGYADELADEYSIPIINKRIAVTPISLIGEACKNPDYIKIAKTLDEAAKEVGVNFVGGYSALVQKGCTKGDNLLIESIPEALCQTERVCSSVNVASSKAGINMDAVLKMSKVIKKSAELTKDKDCIGAAKLVVFCNVPDDNPFMAGAFCGMGEPEAALNVGVSGPGVVRAAVEDMDKTADMSALANKIKQTAYKITSTGELIGRKLSKRLNIPFGVIDLSLAPTPAVGDSVAGIFQAMGLEHAGAHGTTAALAMLNDAVKKGGTMASSHVGGLSGAFIPVSEDAGMIEAAQKEYLNVYKLEAMTSVCSVGAVRIIPAINKKAGDEVSFGGLLGTAPVMPVNNLSSSDFVKRGGRIPAPIHSLNN